MTNEWTKEIETLRARVAALEDRTGELKEALDEILDYRGGADNALEDRYVMERVRGVRDRSASDGTSALDAVVSAAVAARVAAIRARVEALALARCWPAVEGCHGTLMQRDDALRATEGGAP